MKVSLDDIRWLQEILLGHGAAVPEYEQSRLLALQAIELKDDGPVITSRGQELIAEHHRSSL